MSLKLWGFLTSLTSLSMLVAFLLCYFMGGCQDVLTTTSGEEVYMSCRYAFQACAWTSLIGFITAIFLMRTAFAPARKNLIIILWVTILICVVLTTSFGIGLCEDTSMLCHTIAIGVYTMLAIAAGASAFLFVNAHKEVDTEIKK